MPSNQDTHRPALPHLGIESFPLEPISRRDTTSTTATSCTSSSTWTSSSTGSTTSSLAKDALHKLRHPSHPTPPSKKTRSRSWHAATVEDRKRKEVEERVKGIHQQNLYTDCGRHSNEWLFSGWGDLAKWALGSGEKEEWRRSSGEEVRGRGVRRDE